MTVVPSFEADYVALTEACGLVDRSERGKLALTGPDTKAFLNGQLTQDISALTPGSGCYAALLTAKGKMLGDLRVLDTGEELLLDTERAALQDLFNMVRRYSLGHQVELHKRTLECGLLSLIGPEADAVLATAAPSSPRPTDTEHAHVAGPIGRTDVRLVRTDLGIDVLFAADALEDVRAALLEAGAHAVSNEAAECRRIETGRPRFGIDLDNSVIPQEAGLNDRAVSFTKGCYVGQETVARLFYKGKPNRELRGLRSGQPLVPGDTFTFDGREVATVTSATDSPRFGQIGLALVRREAPLGSVVSTDSGGIAEVVQLPFS